MISAPTDMEKYLIYTALVRAINSGIVDESKIRKLVQSRISRKLVIEATASWYTPAGKKRSAPIYEAEVKNEYLNKGRTIKGKSTDEIETKARKLVETWAEQEIRKRIADGKLDAKRKGSSRGATP